MDSFPWALALIVLGGIALAFFDYLKEKTRGCKNCRNCKKDKDGE